MPFAIDQAGQNAQGQGHGLGLFALDGGQLLLLFAQKIGLREGGVQGHIGVDFERRIQVGLQCRKARIDAVHVGAHVQRGAELRQLLGDLERAARLSALVQRAPPDRRNNRNPPAG